MWEFSAKNGLKKRQLIDITRLIINLMKIILHFPREIEYLDYDNEVLNDLTEKYPTHNDLIWYFRKSFYFYYENQVRITGKFNKELTIAKFLSRQKTLNVYDALILSANITLEYIICVVDTRNNNLL